MMSSVPELHKIKSIYDRAYAAEGLMGTHFDREYSRFTKTTLLDYCKSLPSLRVLDLGTGDGDLWEFAPSGVDAYGLDVSEVGVRAASGRFEDLKALVGTAENLPYADDSFGAVVAADTLEHTRDLDQVLREINRVLMVGGVLACSIPVPDSLRRWGLNTFVKQRPSMVTAGRLFWVVARRAVRFGRPDFQPIDMDMPRSEWIEALERAEFCIEEEYEWPEAPKYSLVYLVAGRKI